ncbi:hypothetical protein [Actinoalloteichus hymeniacidonis]|uniref:Uncharacterized protein n=1 Tax=Actinoalloteichus hymeniacidonis TaxID=340345 RepID=A0AAC9MVU2_9PSEU|nr:hypothetical protein [Actinoalloteichus hymeniacidonis]AOS61498.1 hypothetical protein TL08_03330 [Actinoalloteichus hymeniacidonis]MBB5910494.1 hypothetical protein [Actinoalloteichus hymeniacidonis]
MAAKFTVFRSAEDIDKAMMQVRKSMEGIPFRFSSFKKKHDELARDIAAYSVALTDAESIIRD